jgi:hypothetical protein
MDSRSERTQRKVKAFNQPRDPNFSTTYSSSNKSAWIYEQLKLLPILNINANANDSHQLLRNRPVALTLILPAS